MKIFTLVTLLFEGEYPVGFYNAETKKVSLDGTAECAVEANFAVDELALALSRLPDGDILKKFVAGSMQAMSTKLEDAVAKKFEAAA